MSGFFTLISASRQSRRSARFSQLALCAKSRHRSFVIYNATKDQSGRSKRVTETTVYHW
jgi:hypothetical protein